MVSPRTNVEESASDASVPFPWYTLGWFSLLFVLAYLPVIRAMVAQWWDEPDMGHGFFVPLVSGYIIWQKRGQWLNLPSQPNWWGLAFLAWGVLQLIVATLGVELFLARTAMLFSLVGGILLVRGMPTLRALAWPLFLLFFMIPIPGVVYNQVTLPLQFLASRVAEFALSLLGIPVLREGNILELPSQRLSVVEACSGIRSLLSLSFLALVYSYFFDPRPWMRWVLLAASVPVAIAANALRVTLTGLLSEYNSAWAEGFFHAAEGWVIFLISLMMLILIHGFLSRAYAAVERS